MRRPLHAVLLALLLGPAPITASAQGDRTGGSAPCVGALVYLGSFAPPAEPSPGIVGARLDGKTGKLCSLGRVADLPQPTWLALHPTKPVLYATRQVAGPTDQGAFAYAIDGKSGDLRLINSAPTGGASPTYLSADARSNTLFAAHWDSAHFSTLPIRPDGGVEAPISAWRETSPEPPRLRGHALERDPGGGFAVGVEYGQSRLLTFRFDAKARSLDPAGSLQLPAGTGPRHFQFGPGGKHLYLLNELVSEVQVYGWDAKAGTLKLEQTQPTTPPGYTGRKWSAAINLSPDSRFLYATNRAEDVVVGFAVDKASGRLTEVQRIASGGKTPREFAISPDGRWMLVANQGSNAVNVFKRDPASGKLTATDSVLNTTQPVAIVFPR